VDLPIFTIHGNHDDPTRDGGPDLLSAVDLLAVSNLVNYFGRQDEVDNVRVSPVLLRKGDTRVALYGMGSMRDERLNRMWQGKKVRGPCATFCARKRFYYCGGRRDREMSFVSNFSLKPIVIFLSLR
jgi:DNA repair exonuclease SbcCD nuclease subunit